VGNAVDGLSQKEIVMSEWLTTTPPPKDREFLANIGYPWAVVCRWNEYQSEWVYSMLEVNMMDGEYNDTYFSNEYAKEDEVVAWMELPIIKEVL